MRAHDSLHCWVASRLQDTVSSGNALQLVGSSGHSLTSKKSFSWSPSGYHMVLAQFFQSASAFDNAHFLPQEGILHNEPLVVPVRWLPSVAFANVVVARERVTPPAPHLCQGQRHY